MTWWRPKNLLSCPECKSLVFVRSIQFTADAKMGIIAFCFTCKKNVEICNSLYQILRSAEVCEENERKKEKKKGGNGENPDAK